MHRRAQAHRFSDASWWFAEGWRKVNAREQQIDGEMSMLWPCRAKITWVLGIRGEAKAAVE